MQFVSIVNGKIEFRKRKYRSYIYCSSDIAVLEKRRCTCVESFLELINDPMNCFESVD